MRRASKDEDFGRRDMAAPRIDRCAIRAATFALRLARSCPGLAESSSRGAKRRGDPESRLSPASGSLRCARD